MNQLSKIVPGDFLKTTLRQQPKTEEVVELTKAVDGFTAAHPQAETSLASLKEQAEKSKVRHENRTGIWGVASMGSLLGLAAAMSMGIGLPQPPWALVAPSALAVIGSTSQMINQDNKRRQAILTASAVDQYGSQTLRSEESRDFLSAYQEADPDCQPWLPEFKEEALLQLQGQVGLEQALEMWPLAQDYAADPRRDSRFQHLALTQQHLVGENLPELWSKVKPAEDEHLVKPRLELASAFARHLDGPSSFYWDQVGQIAEPERAAQIVAQAFSPEPVEVPVQLSGAIPKKFPVEFDRPLEVSFPGNAEDTLTLQVKAKSSGTVKLYGSRVSSKALCSGVSGSRPEQLTWKSIEVPPQPKSTPAKLGTSDGDPVYLYGLKAFKSDALSEKEGAQLLQCLQQPRGLEQLEKFHQATGSWSSALKMWQVLQS